LKLVLDANVMMAALIRDSHTRHFLFFSGHEFFAPAFLLDEVSEHINAITEKTGLTRDKISQIVENIVKVSGVTIVTSREVQDCLLAAERVSPDVNDVPYFAVSLKLHCPIWSNDKRLKEQNEVRILSSAELMKTGKNL